MKNFAYSANPIGLALKLFLVLSVMATLLVGIQLPAAQAAGGCATTGECLSVEAGAALGGGGGGGGDFGGNAPPAVVGSGGVVQAPATPCIKRDPSDPAAWCAQQYFVRVSFIPSGNFANGGNGPLFCPTKTVYGFKVEASGQVKTERQDIVHWWWDSADPSVRPQPVYSAWRLISQKCVYPPDPVITNTNMSCILSISATFDRTAVSFLGTAARLSSPSETISSISELESKGQASCVKNAKSQFNYSVASGQKGWGQYVANSSSVRARCDFATVTFDGQAKNIGKCVNTGSVPGSSASLTIWCNGSTKGLVMKDWTGADCRNTGGATGARCTIPNAATYGGFAGNVQGLRDGNYKPVQWGTPQLTGAVNNASNWRSLTTVNNGSTPRVTSVDDNDTQKQLFKSDQGFGSWLNSQNLTQNIAYYQAGDSGSPFSMHRQYLYDAWFTTIHTTVNNIDIINGNISTSTSYENVFVKNNKCDTQESPNINVVRAIGDVVPSTH